MTTATEPPLRFAVRASSFVPSLTGILTSSSFSAILQSRSTFIAWSRFFFSGGGIFLARD